MTVCVLLTIAASFPVMDDRRFIVDVVYVTKALASAILKVTCLRFLFPGLKYWNAKYELLNKNPTIPANCRNWCVCVEHILESQRTGSHMVVHVNRSRKLQVGLSYFRTGNIPMMFCFARSTGYRSWTSSDELLKF